MSDNVGKGFSLVMELEDPGRLIELMLKLDDPSVKPRIQAALASLDYVHFARFLPLWDKGLLLIVTEFDGQMQDYVMDFATVLDDEFSLILSYMKGRPPLPVSRYPVKFWEYVDRNTGPKTTNPAKPERFAYPDVFSDYPGVTALEVAGGARAKLVPPPKAWPQADVRPDLSDAQGHTIRAYKAALACHLGFQFAGAQAGRDMLGALAAHLARADAAHEKDLCITLGLTHAGLQAIDLPQATLEQFPRAFREGPRLRSERLGDVGRSDPMQWRVGGYERGHPMIVHGMVSVYTNLADPRAAAAIDKGLARVSEAMAIDPPLTFAAIPTAPTTGQPSAGQAPGRASVCFTCQARAIGDQGEIHFGYRDGVGQPRYAGMSSSGPKTSTPASPAGDLLLGPQLRNSRGGFYIGELPAELASNGTYAALRVIEQDVKAFEKLLDDVKKQHSVARELTAAKLVGRWRNGSPLALYPSQAREERTPTPAELIDTFDYTGQKYPAEARALAKTGSAPTEPINDDEGRRCPFGAHVRRLNPRSGMVLGVPWGRRIVRRGMPYGSKFDRTFPTDEPRGLVGLFLCGDLESQFEFIQHVWANQDLSAPGLRDTQDVFSSANAGTPFRFRPQEFGEEISITVPPLTTTIGSAYLFMPGIEAVRWLGREGWKQMAARNSSKTSRATTMGKLVLDAASRQFLDSPYEQYAAFRKQAPVGEVGAPYGTLWVFSHKLVTEVNQKKDVFLKPGGKRTDAAVGPFAPVNHLKDGLFFMDPPRHGQVRPLLDKIFDKAIVDARQYAEEAAKGLLDAALPLGQMDAIGDYAGQVASQVFFRVMGVPQMAWQLVDNWVRSALNSHRATMPLEQRAIGGSAGLAMRVYLRGLMVEAGNSSPLTLLAGMHGMTASTGTATKMDSDEAMNTAMHFALGGYLSTEFLIGTGVFNLLRNPEQWQLLLNNRKLMDQAIDEMLRYDAPFQLADRWVEKTGVTLGGVAIPPNTGLAVVYGSANRDEKVFSNPDRFDITRDLRKSPKDPTPNFGFGDGIHRCIGEWLARPVTAVAINALLERCPSARIAEYQWGADPYFRTLTKLQLYLR